MYDSLELTLRALDVHADNNIWLANDGNNEVEHEKEADIKLYSMQKSVEIYVKSLPKLLESSLFSIVSNSLRVSANWDEPTETKP